MPVERNKAVVRSHFEEIWSKGNLDFVDENLTPDIVSHDPMGWECCSSLASCHRQAGPAGNRGGDELLRDFMGFPPGGVSATACVPSPLMTRFHQSVFIIPGT